MTTKRLELTLDDETFQKLEEDRIKNGFKDKQDVVYFLLRKRYFVKNSLFEKIKDFFRFN